MAVALAHLPEEDRTRLPAHEVDDGVDADLRSPLTERLLVRRNVEFPARPAALAEYRTEPHLRRILWWLAAAAAGTACP